MLTCCSRGSFSGGAQLDGNDPVDGTGEELTVVGNQQDGLG
jgi:hypothetical protein